MFLFKYRSSNITLNLCLKILQCVKNMINIHHMLHCLMLRRYMELNFRLDFFLLEMPGLLSLTNTQQRQKGSCGTWNRKGIDLSFMSHYASAQLATTSSLTLGNLLVWKISNPRVLGKQGSIYQAGISTVQCTGLSASKETLFIWQAYGNVTLHSCCLTICLPFHQVLGPASVSQIVSGCHSCYPSTDA